MQNSRASADVTAIPVTEVLRQEAAVQQARAKALAFILAGGAAGLTVLNSSSLLATMCCLLASVAE